MMTRWMAAFRLAGRELRSGELTILVAAIVIAVASSTTVNLLSDRLNRTMTLQAAEFIAADLVVTGHDPTPDAWAAEASVKGLAKAETVEFPSVLMANDQILLAGIKAASPGYPLRGRLRTTTRGPAEEIDTADVPRPGQVWVDQRVLTTLGLGIGDEIEVGDKRLTIDRILTREPDPRGDLYSLAPRVLMHLYDLAATRVIQPGSHVHHYALYSGPEEAILSFKRWLEPQLHPGQRILDVHEDRPEVGNALKRAQRYLGLTTLAVILIAGCAIAMSVRRYTERHYDLTAMLKCFGLSATEVTTLYALQFLAIGSMASLLGCGLAWLFQEGAVYLLKDMLPQALVPASGTVIGAGIATGLLVLMGFALPPLLRLGRCAPLRVLRRDLEPAPSSVWTVYGLALGALGLLLWQRTEDLELTALILGGALLVIALLAGIAWALLSIVDLPGSRLGIAWRFAARNLSHNRALAISQVLVFGVTLIAMLLTVLVRTELLAEWQRQLPRDAPNHFALNVFESDVPGMAEVLKSGGIRASAFYPIVRGRLTAVNGVDVRKRGTSDGTADAALNRDLSLTWSATVPDENLITDGHWWSEDRTPQVSVEERLAGNLKLRLGDRLSFNIAGSEMDATVTSFRRVRWDTMMPNFFMILSPGSLERHPHTYLTSFYVPSDNKGFLLQLTKAFPNISLLEVDRLLQQFQMIIRQVGGAVEYLLLFALAAGFIVLFAAVRASLDARLYLDAVCRALGARQSVLRRSLWLEFGALGLIAGLLAALSADLVAWVVFERGFNLDPHVHPLFWLGTPLIAAVAIGTAGYWNARRYLRKSPITVFREL
ncbi:ABC transporter permease [Methylotetracoccus oryzae]|uniref:ABC transporter permease n=1 Tax=Methylotetracoccus oryzae TaxID=1919059 RepID=UPI001F465606|nr:FtsX-like permease family protein [Methylotetracoccus oryzae]